MKGGGEGGGVCGEGEGRGGEWRGGRRGEGGWLGGRDERRERMREEGQQLRRAIAARPKRCDCAPLWAEEGTGAGGERRK